MKAEQMPKTIAVKGWSEGDLPCTAAKKRSLPRCPPTETIHTQP